ncbi:MAG TPA: aldo/keto reductase [Kofleriaceae bacterium]|nr:aldo/keto reductase [Kofleriaceae bacterium]
MIGVLAEDARDRIHALRDAHVTPDMQFVLRRVLFTDRDAEVRATAARRLGEIAGTEAWLVDALADHSPLVRDTVLRALAVRGGDASRPALRRIARTDRIWWVRRSAAYALAAISGDGELVVFEQLLADPFWRVRHAAVRVLAALGARDPAIRDEIAVGSPSSTLTYLRASWGPVAIEAPVRATSASALPAELLDPDPAVVTARLAAGSFSPVALVELLCDPHVPLRLLAIERVARSRNREAYLASLDWLEEPRIPHVVDAVERMLDGLGDPALAIATEALARDDRPGAARWAIAWVIAAKVESLYEQARRRACTSELRRVAVPIATIDELLAWSADDALADAIAAELHERRAFDALIALDGAAHPRVRALQTDALARSDAWDDVELALGDPHHGPRAVATRWLVRTHRSDGVAQLTDPDPSVREAALTPATAVTAVRDPDPFVARAAMEIVVATWQHRDGVPAEVVAVATEAIASRDPWMRVQACRLPVATQDVLACLGDRDAMVRAAAMDAMDGRDVHVALATRLPERARMMAYAWLVRDLDDAAGELARAALAGETSERIRGLLDGIATAVSGGVAPIAIRDESPFDDDDEQLDRQIVARRPFGRAGFDIAPLAISGAFDLSVSSLHRAADAGIDGFFWEPRYDSLTRFLRARRRHDANVIAGSYHGEPDAIENDVDLALRRLRRDTIDVFLLFWTRSPHRVDAAAYESLSRLKRAGKIRAIGFSTHHRELARDAITSQPWDVVMIRHSAAHPGIETELLPAAREHGTAILTFSALCYGRMLSGPNAPRAPDCYRYSIAQPGVTACISAPRRHAELVDNLGVLTAPPLTAAELAALREHGKGVRAENQRFNTLLRQPTRDAAAAAREMLAAEMPPADEIVDRPMPRAGNTRARTSLGTSRSRRGRRP